MRIALFLFCLFCSTIECQALDLEISARLRSAGKRLVISLIPSESIVGCTSKLYAAGRSAALQSSAAQGTLLAEQAGSDSLIQFVASRLKLLRIKSNRQRRPIYFRAQVTCDLTTTESNIVRVKFLSDNDRGVRGLQRWLGHLENKLLIGNLALSEAFPSLSFDSPIDIQNAGDNRLFVVEQSGKIFVFERSELVNTKTTFLDVSDIISSGGERGLLGLAFHPNYQQNGYFFVNYTRESDGATVIARYAVSSDPDLADADSRLQILVVEQPFANHNGGQLAFGPDGYLYIGLGDGGSGGDPLGHGQDRTTLLGDMLRIDIDNTSSGINYAIPTSNPYRGNTSGFKEEIYAYGLRNPWRFSFDSANGRLWAADVGQSSREEINIIESGGNYGWNTMEGNDCYSPSTNCNQTNLTLPIHDYSHDLGESVTGGYVYRGSDILALSGRYIFADFISGRIWALKLDGASASVNQLFDTDLFISSFGIDNQGEHYLASYQDGKIYKLNKG